MDPDAQRRLLLSSDDAAIPLQMAEYFEATLCANMPPIQLAALMDASVLDQFTAEALAMITQRDDSWPLIEAQIRDGTFINYLDENRLWVVFHPMFGRHLRERLRAHNPPRFIQLHRRAAKWFTDHGFGIEASRHAQYLPDAIAAARIIEGAGGIRAEMGQARWFSLERLTPHGPLTSLPMVSLSQIYGLMRNGKLSEARHAFEQLREKTDDFQKFEENSNVSSIFEFSVIIDTLLTVTEDRPLNAAKITLLEQIFHGHQASDPIAKGSVSSVLTHIYADQGRYDDAQLISDAGLQILRPCGPTKAGVFLRIQQAMNVLRHGNVGKSMLILEDAERLSRHGGKFEPYEYLAIQIVKSELLFEDAQLGEAELVIQHVLTEIGHVGSWLNLTLTAYSIAANLAARKRGFSAAMDIVTQAEQLARRRSLPRLQQYMAVHRLYLMTRCGEWNLAAQHSNTTDFENIITQNSDIYLKNRALMELARLYEEMGRPAEALSYLQRVELPPMSHREGREHFRFHMLSMRAKFGLRRYNSAFEHMLEAVQGAANAGLRLRMQDNFPRFMDVIQWAERFGKKLPPAVSLYLKEFEALAGNIGASAAKSSQSSHILAHNFALSPRETEVIALIAEGYLTKEIADRLGISDGTVKSHRKKIHEKLNVTSKSQAIARARELLII
jgi:ATP/maltotriose-dependent transcriptional regulator MalT